ncbi:type II secretion system protein M [Janthinobacterium sp. GW460P]|uniref:type II secretion system protein GspM n=1 Tax=unclassified Janthinobacterium TaxID=2610881 RepID=UPI000A329094|nr:MULTISPECIES: type II secretion system protein GspM [unclassified Janthinobacterium]MCC7703912.1 type II secretion system protein M [Janthinobacterium sp. GW460P]MCC7709419.1 type II secretion system protein M [Janthinobacterium sp. GW460W]
MKQQWQKFALKFDALSVRERIMIFGASAALLIFMAFYLFIDPQLAKRKALADTIAQRQQAVAAIDNEVAQRMAAHAGDPDQQDRIRLERIRQEVQQMRHALQSTQNGLVAPERIVPMLQQLLKQQARLHLVSLATLPSGAMGQGGHAAAISASAPAATPAAKSPAESEPAKAPALLYRHGVEIVLRGNYLDMVNYMDAVEAMPAHVFWGKVNMQVEQYPNATLSLTLYTLSLDEKWIAL